LGNITNHVLLTSPAPDDIKLKCPFTLGDLGNITNRAWPTSQAPIDI